MDAREVDPIGDLWRFIPLANCRGPDAHEYRWTAR